jgi:tyrosine-protein phosphatase YwqE
VSARRARGAVGGHREVADIDDGAKTPDDSVAMLRELRAAGFDVVVATPHRMCPE